MLLLLLLMAQHELVPGLVLLVGLLVRVMGPVEQLRARKLAEPAAATSGAAGSDGSAQPGREPVDHGSAPGMGDESRRQELVGRRGLQVLELLLKPGEHRSRRLRRRGRRRGRRDQHQCLVRGPGLTGRRYEQHDGLGGGRGRLVGRLVMMDGRRLDDARGQLETLVVFRLFGDQMIGLRVLLQVVVMFATASSS